MNWQFYQNSFQHIKIQTIQNKKTKKKLTNKQKDQQTRLQINNLYCFTVKKQKNIRQLISKIIIYLTFNNKAYMLDNIRKFGADVQNISSNSNNHIVLKSRGFSFENKNKVYVENRVRNVQRRLTMAYVSKPYLIRNTNKCQSQQKFTQGSVNRLPQKQQAQIEYKYLEKIKNNQLTVPTYIHNCMKFMRKRQKTLKISQVQRNNPSYLIKRAEVIDQLSAIHSKMDLSLETLSIAVSYMDRFLSVYPIEQKQYKLISVIGLFMAAKFQEVYCQKLHKFLSIAHLKAQKYKVEQIQQKILTALSFELVYDSPINYIKLYSMIGELSHKNQCIAQYLLQLAMTNKGYIQFSPSILAAAAVFTVQRLRKVCSAWANQLQQLTGYTQQDLLECSKFFCSLIQNINEQDGINIHKKYSQQKYCQASLMKFYRTVV